MACNWRIRVVGELKRISIDRFGRRFDNGRFIWGGFARNRISAFRAETAFVSCKIVCAPDALTAIATPKRSLVLGLCGDVGRHPRPEGDQDQKKNEIIAIQAADEPAENVIGPHQQQYRAKETIIEGAISHPSKAYARRAG